MTPEELQNMAKSLLDVKIFQTDDSLERAALEAAAAALIRIERRMKEKAA